MSRVLRCSACARRIKAHHPHIGLLDIESGKEIYSCHAKSRCQQHGAGQLASLLERGKAYILRHYHSSACPDERPGFGCAGGCFDTPMAVAN